MEISCKGLSLGRIVQFPRQAKEQFRLDGQAERLACARTRQLLTVSEELEAVSSLRKMDKSQELKRYEIAIRKRYERENAYVEIISQAFTAAELAAPRLLREIAYGKPAILIVLHKTNNSGAAFGCTSNGAVLIATHMVIRPNTALIRSKSQAR